MKNFKKIFSFLVLSLLCIPFSLLLTACGEKKETELIVLYNNEQVSSQGKTITIERGKTLESIENCIVVKVKYDDDSEQVLEKGQDSRRYQVETTLVDGSLEAGKTYTYKISYKSFGTYTLTFNVTKYENKLVIKDDVKSKNYDGNPYRFYNNESYFTATNRKDATFTWYKKNDDNSYEKLESAPINAGVYKIEIYVPESSVYFEAHTSSEIKIYQKKPSFEVPQFGVQNNSNVTKLSDISLSSYNAYDGTLSWENGEMLLVKGNNKCNLIFTPNDTLNYKIVTTPVTISYYHTISVPTLTGTYGGVQWEKVENATGYEYQIDNNTPVQLDANTTSVTTMNWGETIKVRALGSEAEFYQTSDYSSSYTFAPTKEIVSNPNTITVTYNGKEQTVQFSNIEEDLVELDLENSASLTQTNAGTYRYYFKLKNKNYYKWRSSDSSEDLLVEWTIRKQQSYYYGNAISYTGTYSGEKLGDYPFTQNLNARGLSWADENSVPTCDRTTYTAIYIENNNGNYLPCEVTVTITLQKATPTYTKLKDMEISETTTLYEISLPSGYSFVEGQTLVSGTKAYNVMYTPSDTVNYKTDIFEVNITYSAKAIVSVPKNVSTTYNGSEQTLSLDYDESLVEIDVDSSASLTQTNAGTYSYVLKLVDAENTMWADNTTENKTITWEIKKLEVALPSLVSSTGEVDSTGYATAQLSEESKLWCVFSENNSTSLSVNEGEFNLAVDLKDKDNCVWADNTTETKNVSFKAVVNYFEEISLDGKSLTIDEFNKIEKLAVGSTLSFTPKANYNVLINGEEINSITISSEQYSLYVAITDESSYTQYAKEFEIYVVDTLQINSSSYQPTLKNRSIDYDLAKNETKLTISFDNATYLKGLKYSIVGDTSENDIDLSGEISIADASGVSRIYIMSNSTMILEININSYSLIEKISATIYDTNEGTSQDIVLRKSNANEYYFSNYGILTDLRVLFKEDSFAYELFNSNGDRLDNLLNQSNMDKITLKVIDQNNRSVVETKTINYNNFAQFNLSNNNNISSYCFNAGALCVFSTEEINLDSESVKTNYNFENQNIVLNNDTAVSYSEYGIYEAPLKVSCIIDSNEYYINTKLIANYSQSCITTFVDSIKITYNDTYCENYRTIYYYDETNISTDTVEYSMLEKAIGSCTITSETLKENYTLEESEIVEISSSVYGLRLVFSDGTNTYTVYTCLSIYGKNNSNTNISEFKARKVTGETYSVNIETENGNEVAYIKNFNSTDYIYLETENQLAQIVVKDGSNNVLSEESMASFPSAGTYYLTITSSDKTATREIILYVSGDFAPLLELKMASGTEDEVMLYMEMNGNEMPTGNCELGMNVDSETGNPIGYKISGYFGEIALNYLTENNGVEYLPIKLRSSIMGKIYFDENKTQVVTVDEETNETLVQVVSTESGKYIVLYADMGFTIPCYFYLYSKQATENPAKITINGEEKNFNLNISDMNDFGDLVIDQSTGNSYINVSSTATEITLTLSKDFEDYSYACFTDNSLYNTIYYNGQFNKTELENEIANGKVYVVDSETKSVTIPVTFITTNGTTSAMIFFVIEGELGVAPITLVVTTA